MPFHPAGQNNKTTPQLGKSTISNDHSEGETVKQEHADGLNSATKEDLIDMLDGLEDDVYDHTWFRSINYHLGRYADDVQANIKQATSDEKARQVLIEAFPTEGQTNEGIDIITWELARRGIPIELFLVNVVHLGTVLARGD